MTCKDTKNWTRSGTRCKKMRKFIRAVCRAGQMCNPGYFRHHVVLFEMLMKTIHLCSRLFAALACTIGLAACGGGNTTITVGGAISGLTVSGLTLSNGVGTVSPAVNAVSYILPGSINEGSAYAIVVVAQPVGLACTVANNAGVAGSTNITNADVTCEPNIYKLGGTVTGLTADGLVLANGSATATLAKNTTSFTFPTTVISSTSYGVTVLTQPPGLTCTVTNGTGIVAKIDVTTVTVNCI